MRRMQSGMSLIEMMIALVLGLLLMAAVFQIYLSGRQTQQLQTALISRQESLRYATLHLKRDVAQAGWRGCSSRSIDYVDTLNPNPAYLFHNGVQGNQATLGTWLPPLDPAIGSVLPGTDVLTVRYGTDTGIYVREDMPDSSAVIKINLDADLAKINNGVGQVALITSCAGSALFQMTGYSVSSGTLGHNTGFDPPIGNSTKDLGKAHRAGAKIMLIDTVRYFLRESPDGTGPSLFRMVNDDPAVELAKGIEDMQLRYGVDADLDDVPEAYVTAELVADWRNVVAVRVGLLAVSLDGATSEDNPNVYNVLDRTVGPFTDRRLRRVLNLTLGIRNAQP